MAPKKSKGQGAKTAAGIAGDVDAGACKLHVAMARPGINVSAKSTADSIMEALKQDIADGNTEAVNKPIPRSGVTVLQLAITSGAGQLVKRMLAENVFDIPQMEKTNLDDGQLPLLHEAVKSGSEDVLNAMLEKLQTTADACNNRAVMLEKFLRTYGDDCGPRTFQMKNGSTAVSAIAAAAMLCHGFPMELVLTELTKAFASVMSSNEADAAAVAKSAEALTPVCPAIMQKVTEAAASMVTSPASVAAVPIPQAYWLSASAVLIAREKPLPECGFDSSVFSSPHLMAVHMSTPPKGLQLTRMLPSQFYTFWASLNTDFAASESALEHFLAAGQQFGLEALYLARAIPDACPLREKWINACVPPASAGTTLGSLLAASIHVPSPLKLNVAPAEFERIWFPSCAVEEAEGGDEAAGGDGDAVEEYRSEIWRKFMLSRDVPVLSAVLAEGMAGDGKVVQALLASATGTDEDEHTLSREVYDSCNSVPDVVGAALRQVEAEPGAAVPLAEWRVESMQGGGDVPLSENCTCTPMLEFVQSVNRWEDAEDARLALEALVSKARTLSGPALSGAPVCNLMPWTSDLLPVPGSADTSEDGKPIVPGAEHLSSTASQADVDLGRALVGAASGIVAGRGLPDPGGQRTAPIAFKVLQWLLNLDGALLAMREQLGFPFHLRGLDQDSGDLLIEALWGTSPDVLHLIVQHIADNDFKATADWADVNMAALACFRGWSEGVAAVLAVPSVDPMAPINDAGDTPLHWLCKAGSSWADVTVGGKSVDIYAATTALMAPGELKPSQIRGVVTELAAYKDGAMANAVDAASRTPLFYAHSPAAIEALLDAGADVNARDCDGLDCVAFRITETMALDTDKFDLSVKDQIRAIVAHHDYNHQAHFEIKSENAQAGGADDDGGSAVCCVEKYAADHCPLDRDIELILHTTSAMKDIYRIRLPDVPRSKISNHVRTWMAFISKKEFCKNDLHTGDLLVKLEQTEPNLRRRFLSAFRDFCKFPKEKLQQWDAESAMYYMDKLQKGIDDGKIPLEGHNHTICFAETMLEDVNERFGREALKTVLGFGKADWDEAITFMQPECQCDDPEHDHPTVTLYEFLRDKRGVAVKELPDPTKETPGCTVPLAQKKKHKLLPAPDAPATVPLLESSSAPKSKVKSGFKRGFFGKAPEKSEVTTGKDSGKARPAWVEKCSTYGSDVLKGIEKTEMRKRIVACMGHKDAKAKDENGAIKRLLAFYDSSVDVRSASMADVSSIAMPPKTKPSLKFAQWLKAEGTEFMAQAKKKEKPKTLGPPIPDNHKFAPLKSTMWEGAWTMYYLSCCALLDAMANGKDALGKANFTTAGDEYCKALSNMAQACLSAAATGKDYQRGDKITQAQLREMLMSAVSTATAALACSNISNMDGLELKNLRRLRSALSMLADDTQSEQARQASKSMEAYVADKEKEAKQAAAT